MRIAVVALFVLVIAAVALASPAKQPSCARPCPQIYDPICARAKNGNKERLLTFGNPCVMGNYNCEHSSDPFERKSVGECGDKVSVRLQ